MADGIPPPPLQLEGREVAEVTANLVMRALNSFPPALGDDAALASTFLAIVCGIEERRPETQLRAILRDFLDDPRLTIDG